MAASKNMTGMAASVFALLIFLASSCSEKTKPAASAPVVTDGAVPVTVIDYSELDGCTWLLELSDGQKLEPVNLSEEYKQKGLKLLITYKNQDGMSICMAGRMVTLTSVSVAKEDNR